MTDFKFLYIHVLAWLLPSIYLFLLGLAIIIAITLTFGISPPKVTQASLHLLNHFSAPTPTIHSLVDIVFIWKNSKNIYNFVYKSNSDK